MPLQPVLDYEPLPPKRPPIWRRSVLLWAIVCVVGYSFALIGPLFVAGGIICLYADPQGSSPMGVPIMPVQTVTQKLALTLLGLMIGALGIGFVAYIPPSQAFLPPKHCGDEA